jgi:hypothetical protein
VEKFSTLKTLQREMWSTYATHAVSGHWENAVHPTVFKRWCELVDTIVEANNTERSGVKEEKCETE